MDRRNILFVDDEQEILNSLKRLLHREPYKSFYARSGQEAAKLLEREDIHVIITDLGMPGIDGLALLEEVEEKHPEIVRLVLSGRSDRNSVVDAINRGKIHRYIPKPWDNTEFKLVIRQAIDLFNLQEEKGALLEKLAERSRSLEDRANKRTEQLAAIEAEAEMGRYVAQFAHELNSPAQAILVAAHLADLAISKGEVDLEALQKHVGVIKTNSLSLLRIIEGILTRTTDEIPCWAEQVDVNRVIERELDFFKLNPVFRYGVETYLDLLDNLPCLAGNPSQIERIVGSLVQNAIDAMEHSAKKRLTIQTYLQDNAVAIRISDTGEGIAEDHLEALYSPDFTTKPVGKGTGLGLAMVKTTVDAYSGDIRVQSRKGEGTTFTVRIPVKPNKA